MAIPRKTIDEVKARLEFEPKIREIYVEGAYDRDFLQWVVGKLGLTDIRVYPISSVEVPASLLATLRLTSGERQRVQAMASMFEDHVNLHGQILFFMDADLDYILERADYSVPLCLTSGTCTEMIFWRKSVLEKFFSMNLGSQQPAASAENLMRFVEPIAIPIFLLRTVREVLNKRWELIDLEKAIEKGKSFSFQEYCEKVAHKNNDFEFINKSLSNELEKIQPQADQLGISKKMHGHDVMAIVSRKLCLDGFAQRFLKDPEELGRVLMSSADWSAISDDDCIAMIGRKFIRQTN